MVQQSTTPTHHLSDTLLHLGQGWDGMVIPGHVRTHSHLIFGLVGGNQSRVFKVLFSKEQWRLLFPFFIKTSCTDDTHARSLYKVKLLLDLTGRFI